MTTHDQQPTEQARLRRRGRSDGTAAGRIEVPSVDAAGLTAVRRLLHGGGPVAPPMVAGMAAVAGNAAATSLVRSAAVRRAAALTAQGAGPLDPRTAAAIDAERGRGSPLPDPVRTDMEQQLGADLSAVRVHTGPAADTLSRAVTAQAFTTGTDVFFRAGRYHPTSPAGRELLAHELTHVVQPDNPGAAARVSHEDDPAELQARAIARGVAQSSAAPPSDEPEAAPVREAAGAPAVGRAVVARDPWHNEGTAGTGRSGPIGYIRVGRDQISSDPQTATQQLRDIAVRDGIERAHYVITHLRLEWSHQRSAEQPTYWALIAALDTEVKGWDQFEDKFKEAARRKTEEMLTFSEQRVRAEVDRYGLTDKRGSGGGFSMARNHATADMASAARQLADEVTKLEGEVTRYETRRLAAERRGLGVTAHPQRVQVHQAERRYLAMRHEKEALFPALSSFAAYQSRTPDELRAVRRKLEAVGRGVDDENAVGMVAGDSFKKLENIAKVRAALADKSLNVWAADNVVSLTKKELGIAKGSLRDRIIDQQVADDASSRALRNMLIGAVAVALALFAAPLAAGGLLVAGATATAAGVALSAGLAIEHVQEYQLADAANATDYDKANVISTQEPSLFWLALDIVGVLADLGGAVQVAKAAAPAFKSLAPRARAAVSAGDDGAKAALDALEQAAAKEVPGSPELGRTLRESAEQERARIIRLHHGTDGGGLEGLGGLGPGKIDVAHKPGGHQDLGRGFYLTLDEETAVAYANRRAVQRGDGRARHVLTWEVDEADLATNFKVVDIRPDGNFRAEWEAFLEEAPRPGNKPLGTKVPGMETNRQFLTGFGAEKRGEVFEVFLAKHGQADADFIFAPLGDGVFTGITKGSESVQVCVRSPKAAAVLNAQMRPPPIAGPAGSMDIRQPASRHNLNRIGGKSPAKTENTVVMPGVDAASDLRAIESGKARWNPDTQRYELPNGRIYGVEDNGTLFPVSGPGLEPLGRGEYQALQHFIRSDGDIAAAEAAMARNPFITESDKKRALEIFRHHNKFRG
jgi:hypothetical protein